MKLQNLNGLCKEENSDKLSTNNIVVSTKNGQIFSTNNDLLTIKKTKAFKGWGNEFEKNTYILSNGIWEFFISAREYKKLKGIIT